MPSPAAAMLCSVFHLSRRLLRPLNRRFPCPLNPNIPSYPLSSHRRFLSSSLNPCAARWATYEPHTYSLSASAPEVPTDSESDTWTFFDPISGRIFTQSPPHSPSTAAYEKGGGSGEGAGETPRVNEKGKWKGRARARGEEGRARRSSVVAVRNPARKGDKERVSYVCNRCGEGSPRWWGFCCHCQATKSLVKRVLPAAPHSSSTAEGEEVNEDIEKEGEGAGELQVEEKVRVKEKWKDRARRPSVAGRNPKGDRAKEYVCTLCGEGSSQWWGTCRHCKGIGTLARDY